MFSAAISAGVTLACGTTLGGVVFGIETTSTIYLVSNIWKSFFCSAICNFITRLIYTKENHLQQFYVEKRDYTSIPAEIFLFIILGLLGGLIGALFATVLAKGSYIRRKTSIQFLKKRITTTMGQWYLPWNPWTVAKS